MSKLLILVYVLATSFALIALKLSTVGGAPVRYIDGRFLFNLNIYSGLGIFLYAISFVIYVYLISRYDLGYIIPLGTALVYTVIFIASFLIFKETFTALKVAGIVLIVIGLILLNIKS